MTLPHAGRYASPMASTVNSSRTGPGASGPSATPPNPSRRAASPQGPSALRPAVYAGVCAALASVLAAVAIRMAPGVTALVTTVHLSIALLLYATAGAMASRLGAAGWRAGLFAALLDALIGHALAFFISPTPDAASVRLPPGVEATPEVLGSVHLFGALLGAGVAVALGAIAGGVGAWLVSRRR